MTRPSRPTERAGHDAYHLAASAGGQQAWNDVIVARHPFFADYETKAGRTIAVARVTPTG